MKNLFSNNKNNKPVIRRRLSQGVDSTTERPLASTDQYAFRRNRTLTGSLSSDVSSVGEHRAELKSTRVQHHVLRRHRRRLLLFLLLALAAIALLAFLIYQSVARVVIIESENTSAVIDSALYEQKTQQYLADNPLQRFRFSLKTDALAEYLQNNGAPEVQSVKSETTFAGFGTSQIAVAFRRPAAVWSTAGTRVYVDNQGNTFSRNYFAEPGVRVLDQSGVQTKDNQVIASGRLLAFMGRIIGQMEANGLAVTEITLPADTARQVGVRVASAAYPIKFSIDRPAGEQAEDAARSIRYLAANGLNPEYIDVRISGKAYYK